MKKNLIYLLASITFTSCNFLDFDESQGKTQEEAYSYMDNVLALGNAAYRSLPIDFGAIGSAALRESATDNSIYTWDNNAVYDIYNNSWSPINLVDDQWENYYTLIADINSFFENYSEEKLERFKWDPNYEDNMKKIKMSFNELTVLRALYYFELVKRYGDIPLLKNTVKLEDVNSIKKTKAQEVFDFIAEECLSVADKLPVDHNTDFFGETGRVTKGAALAIRARALLYAASPLFIGDRDQEKAWEAAAKAANDVIEMNKYSLPNYKDDPLYDANLGNAVLSSPQLIFETRKAAENGGKGVSNYETQNLPIGFANGTNTGNTPTQNLVDAYEMSDGTTFSWENEDHVNRIYFNEDGTPSRDPRLYLTVLCNGMTFMKQKIESFEGGRFGAPITGATKTGYYLKKMMNETISLDPNKLSSKEHHFPNYRYAEVLLNYAEAMNEWKDPDYKDMTCKMSAIEAINIVRKAVDMKPLSSMTQDEFRTKIRNERRVELAFEDHRFWDIRRWKIGNIVQNIYGVKIVKSGDDSYKYSKEQIQTRIWDNKMYLYPIPANETYLNNNLTQNPGW